MDASTQTAAMLLWRVRTLACKEILDEDSVQQISSAPQGTLDWPCDGHPSRRGRTVSIGSIQDSGIMSVPVSPLSDHSSPCIKQRSMVHDELVKAFCDRFVCATSIPSASPSRATRAVKNKQTPPSPTRSPTPSTSDNSVETPSQRKRQPFVGRKAKGVVRGVLRKKFSWKQYPELEAFLIRNRDEYLVYSSSFNYTPEQKKYNNRLTEQLLCVAADEGYIFENFTFPMVRDRIRCYYKSYTARTRK